MSCYVVGDIHGCLEELRCLIERLPLRDADRIVFLGDYIDRGPYSKGVVSFLLELHKASSVETVFLKGNHEDMLLSYLGLPGRHGEVFLHNGGQATLASYGIVAAGFPATGVAQRMPDEHLEFYLNLKTFCVVDSYLCVHAGIQPLRRLDEQNELDMFWIRSEFIRNPHKLPFTVLFGHTPQKEVLFDLPYKIGLDTGLVYGNKLSCLALDDKVIYQVKRGAKTVQQLSVDEKWSRIPNSRVP